MKLLLTGVLTLFISTQAFGISPFSLPWMNPEGDDPGSINYNSQDYPDSIFVIETFFRMCRDCNRNSPNVNALVAEYLDEPGVQVLDVGKDRSSRDYATWISTNRPNHPVLKDNGLKLIGQLGISSYPSVVILDCHRNIRYKHEGIWDTATKTKIRQTIDNLLNECGW